MLFLAVGQWIFGPNIDRYILFQILAVSCLPAILFLFSTRIVGIFGGLFVASLGVIAEVNQMQFYSQIGSGHVKLENPEVLVGLILLIFSIILFHWIKNPKSIYYPILAGAVIGIATLLRANAFFIAPLTILFVFLLAGKQRRMIIHSILFFMVAFSLVFAPWLFSAKDKAGNNYYFKKLHSVLTYRAISDEMLDQQDDSSIIERIDTQAQAVTKTINSTPEINVINGSSQWFVVSHIGFHFFNNIYDGLAALPTKITFSTLKVQFKLPLWEAEAQIPIWKKNLSGENYTMLMINLSLVIIGIITAWKRHQLAGLSALLVQIGYSFGNAVALTSGGRYQLAANWAILFYYGIGICTCIYLLLSTVLNIKGIGFGEFVDKIEHSNPDGKNKIRVSFLLFLIMCIGVVLPVINFLPSRLPDENMESTSKLAYQYLSQENLVSKADWENFLSDSQKIIVIGNAYHPKYYENSHVNPGHKTFEILVLAKDYVYPSYLFNVEPSGLFHDGSKVIIIGCNIGDDRVWGVSRKNVRAISFINLDQESVYHMSDPIWTCQEAN